MNIERFFAEQIREQRKAGSGAFHRRGKGVKHGMRSALQTPYYFMSKKERAKLNGEVQVSYMYDTIISWDEFKTKNIEQQITMLTRWRELHDNKEIQKQMGIASSPYYKLVKELGLSGNYTRKKGANAEKTPKKERRGYTRKADKIAEQAKMIQQSLFQPKNEIVVAEPKEVVHKAEVMNGLKLEYNKVYSSDQLNKLFTKLQLLVDGEETQFKLKLQLVEVE